jgi:hypothetical protein
MQFKSIIPGVDFPALPNPRGCQGDDNCHDYRTARGRWPYSALSWGSNDEGEQQIHVQVWGDYLVEQDETFR